ncbi:hypothetical protein GDO86_018584 [Hymenochirus boettgeri]|uniref:G-protein coupled receptors family 1 profile domain-containing protein n=1 Tax=Hymenochirus boettgeri TaxID=247094 RepID=A0A8T2IHK8_9PIPI|nr:hypothetical protein GDO86_018584 [Hymenochirus boettgeri]
MDMMENLLQWNASLFGYMSSGNGSFWESLGFSSSVLSSAHEPGTISLVVMNCVSFLVGLVDNVMALRTLGSRRRKRLRLSGVSGSRKLLVNLAVFDMMVICICMPINPLI